MKPLKLLVVIVTYNGRRWLDRCLGSVRTWKPDGSALSAVDLFVVDNASTDGSADFVASEFPEAILVRNDRNLGFGKANNIGMRYALEKGYDYVYLMNQDAWINEITLGRLVRYAENDEDYGVLSPLQFRADGERLDRLFEKRFRSTPDEVYDHSVVEVPFIMAAHWLLPRRTLETVGLFDEIFTHNGEDDNYCDRVRYHGLSVGVASAFAVHDREDRPLSKEAAIRLNCLSGSLARLCNINRPLWERVCYVTFFTLVKSLKYGSTLPWKHYSDLIRMLPRIREARSRMKHPDTLS